MSEKRKEKRFLVYLGGRASFFQVLLSADILIRNASDSGAKLTVRNGNFIPDDFDLMIPARQAEYRAHVCWRRSGEIGVALQ